MRTSVLTPQGVHYDLDDSGRTSPFWPWLLGGLLLAAIITGLLLTFHSRLGKTPPPKRSLSSPMPVVPVALPVIMVKPVAPVAVAKTVAVAATNAFPSQIQVSPEGGTNHIPRLPASVDVEVRHLVEGAEAVYRADDLPSARRRYLALLDRGNLGAATAFVEQRLGEIGMRLLLTPRPMPEKTEYVVKDKDGELVNKIARQYNVTRELLMKANDIRRLDRLPSGQHLLVLDKPVFSITVNLPTHELRLFLNGKLMKRYAVGAGRRGESPPGAYVIHNRQERPIWRRPDGRTVPYGNPENILGTRCLSLQATGTTAVAKEYGIHGTWNDGEIGHSATMGGISMRNADVEELFLIVTEGTPVRVAE